MSCWQLVSTKAGAGEAGYVLNMNEIKLRRNKKIENMNYMNYIKVKILQNEMLNIKKWGSKYIFKKSYGIFWSEVGNINI